MTRKIDPASMRDFVRDMVNLGASGSLGYHFDVAIDDDFVTLENFDDFSDQQLNRAIFHGVVIKNGQLYENKTRASK